MKKTEAIILLMFLIFIVGAYAAAPPVATFWGRATIDSVQYNTSGLVQAFISNVEVATTNIGEPTSGYYIIDVPCDQGNIIYFKIYGVNVTQSSQICSQGARTEMNLSMTKAASSASCTYSAGCSGGYCCSGATQYNGDGTGACQSSVCTAPITPSTGGGGGGGTTETNPSQTSTYTTLPEGATEIDITNSNIPVSELDLVTNENTTNVKIVVTKLNTAPSTDYTGAEVYKYIQIDHTNIENAQITSVKIKFKVEKSWLTSKGVNKENIVLLRYTTKWTELKTTIVGEDSLYVYYEALSPGLSLFAIAEKAAVQAECTESWSCIAWSLCADEKQTRTCTDINACGTVKEKPETERSCSMGECIIDSDCADKEGYTKACAEAGGIKVCQYTEKEAAPGKSKISANIIWFALFGIFVILAIVLLIVGRKKNPRHAI